MKYTIGITLLLAWIVGSSYSMYRAGEAQIRLLEAKKPIASAYVNKTLRASSFGLGKIPDASVAINAMYNAAGDYYVLVIDPGVWDGYAPIRMVGNKHVTVIADQATLYDKGNADVFFTFGADSNGVTNLSRCKIEGLTIGKVLGSGAKVGLQVQNCSISVFRDCTIAGYGIAFLQWADKDHYCYFNIVDNLSTYACKSQIKEDGVAGSQTCHQSRCLKVFGFDTSAAGDAVFDFGNGCQNLVLGASIQTDNTGTSLHSSGSLGGNDLLQLEYIESSKDDMSLDYAPGSIGNRVIANERRLKVNASGGNHTQYYPNATIRSN
jgi:hypothetical protein